MELRVLKYFLMAAREENITRAAQLLHLTQPTLSRQLMQLEDELGVTLFQRSNHRIVLTQDGMLLRRRAQEIVDLAEKTSRDFARPDAALSGEIAIGAGETSSMAALANLVARFRAEHPRVRYRMTSGSADHIKECIERGTLDVGLLVEPVDIARYSFVRLPQTEEWGVLTRADSPIARQGFARPEDLVQRPLMISGREIVQSELSSWFGDLFERAEILMTYNLLYNVAMLVREGVGDALCIRLDCEYDGLRFVPLEPARRMGSVLVWKKNQVASPAVSAFTAQLKKYIEGISRDEI